MTAREWLRERLLPQACLWLFVVAAVSCAMVGSVQR